MWSPGGRGGNPPPYAPAGAVRAPDPKACGACGCGGSSQNRSCAGRETLVRVCMHGCRAAPATQMRAAHAGQLLARLVRRGARARLCGAIGGRERLPERLPACQAAAAAALLRSRSRPLAGCAGGCRGGRSVKLRPAGPVRCRVGRGGRLAVRGSSWRPVRAPCRTCAQDLIGEIDAQASSSSGQTVGARTHCLRSALEASLRAAHYPETPSACTSRDAHLARPLPPRQTRPNRLRAQARRVKVSRPPRWSAPARRRRPRPRPVSPGWPGR